MNIRNKVIAILCSALSIAALGTTAVAADKQETLYLYNWADYMDPAIIKAFEDKYDVTVSNNIFNSNAELFAKLRAGGDSQYDVIVPTDYYIPRLINAGLIQPLDKDLIPNMANIMDRFIDPPFDEGNVYSAPYQWGTIGVVYNTRKLPDLPQSWGAIFDADANPDQPFSTLKGSQVSLGAACAYLGAGYTCSDKSDLVKAAELIRTNKKRKNFIGFMDGTPTLTALARGNIALGVTYNGDYLNSKIEDPDAFADTAYFIPEEGGQLWLDTIAIPANAPHPELANKFINFILDAEIGAMLSNANRYATPNKAAVEHLDDALQNDTTVPDDAVMQRLHFMPALSGKDLQLVEQLWDEVQSQ